MAAQGLEARCLVATTTNPRVGQVEPRVHGQIRPYAVTQVKQVLVNANSDLQNAVVLQDRFENQGAIVLLEGHHQGRFGRGQLE